MKKFYAYQAVALQVVMKLNFGTQTALVKRLLEAQLKKVMSQQSHEILLQR